MKKILFLVFALAVVVRFLYFPQNIYFGYDQARDAFESMSIYKNFDLKIIGPSTEKEGLFHGPLYWYLIGPFYLLGGGDPAFPMAFLLVLNSFGVFVIFWLGKILFDVKTGVIAAVIYSISFGQTQYAMYFTDPAPAVLTIMLFYGGLALVIFKKDWRGLPIALLGLGLSVQFEFLTLYQTAILFLIFMLFRKQFTETFSLKMAMVSFLSLVLSLSTFILSEIKYGPRTITSLFKMLVEAGNREQHSQNTLILVVSKYFKNLSIEFRDNVFAFGESRVFLVLLLGMTAFLVYKRKKEISKVVFLLVWFFSSSIVYLFGIPNLYYFNIGISPALIIMTAYFLSSVWGKAKPLTFILLVLVIAGNIILVRKQNPKGIINDIYVQEGMLLEREKKVIDYIYSEAGGVPISVGALTMPLRINTTWAYLFSWYGKVRYGYLPYWTEASAQGFAGEGVLPKWRSQVKAIHFSIIEPTRGVRQPFVDQFLEEGAQYGEVIDERVFGEGEQARLVVQKRGKL